MSIMHELEEAKRAKAAADRRVEELLGRAKEEGLVPIRKGWLGECLRWSLGLFGVAGDSAERG